MSANNETSDFGLDIDSNCHDARDLSCPPVSPPTKFSVSRTKLNCNGDSNGTILHCVPEEQESLMTGEATTLGCDPDSDSWEWDKELERRGLYRGSYYGYLAMYTLAPFTTFLTFIFLALLPPIVYPSENQEWKGRYPTYIPFPLPELLVSIAFSSLSLMLRTPIFSLAHLISSLSVSEGSRYSSYINIFSALVSCALYTMSALFLRASSIAFLLPPNLISSESAIFTQSAAFRVIWWTGLGWAIAEDAIGTAQGYQSIGLYKDVLVSIHRKSKLGKLTQLKSDSGKGKQAALPRDDVPESQQEPTTSYGTWAPASQSPFEQASSSANVAATATEDQPLLRQTSNASATSSSFASFSLHPSVAWDNPPEEGGAEDEEESELQLQVDRDIDHLLAFRRREELEELYGIPFIKIPVFISCLHRVNTLLLSISLSLLLGATYIYAFSTSSNLAVGFLQSVNFIVDALTRPTGYLAMSTISLHFFLTVLHTPLVLPKIGVHTVVFVCSMLGLGTLFAGLAVWGGLS